jgi:hypothetical protein
LTPTYHFAIGEAATAQVAASLRIVQLSSESNSEMAIDARLFRVNPGFEVRMEYACRIVILYTAMSGRHAILAAY